ncbi:hypothetical protein [Shewanella mangrovisoli]|uniref:hypothetical protein n=1 Tax=Shewanella mangrovisoli TaxID=2864211 RepID=UPI00370C7716
MVRRKETNGIQDTVERLFGDDDYRSILAKLVKLSPIFKPYLADDGEKPYRFKRSDGCDNLIKNVLILGDVFHSNDFVDKLLQNKVSRQEISNKLSEEKLKMEKKFKAYGYWLNRLTSLNNLLIDDFDMTASSIEDCLEPENSYGLLPASSPYALRAVRLLENVEEEGRTSKLSTAQQVEKAWALFRLDLLPQAVELATKVTQEDPENSEAWLLLVMNALSEQRKAARNHSRYMFEVENAEALSAHERWAEEMQDDAEIEYQNAKMKEKSILFNALLNWPKTDDVGTKIEVYKNQWLRGKVLNHCINWLFFLLGPYNGYASSRISLRGGHRINGLEPEYELKYSSRIYFENTERYPPHGLNDVEIAVAKLICDEFDQKQNDLFGIFPIQDHILKLKLLHIRFALQLDGYESAKQHFIKVADKLNESQIIDILDDDRLRNAFTTHIVSPDIQAFLSTTNRLNERLEHERRKSRSHIELNLLRKAFDHSYARNQYSACLQVCSKATILCETLSVEPPADLLCCETTSNKLTTKFWKYIELLAASKEILREQEDFSEQAIHSLLSISSPTQYFSEESEYMVTQYDYDDNSEYFIPSYGESIIVSGLWLEATERLLNSGRLNEMDTLDANTLRNELINLRDDDRFMSYFLICKDK